MVNFLTRLLGQINKTCQSAASIAKMSQPKHVYRMLSIEKDENEFFVAVIQISATRQTFKIKPEEILANDQMTDSFSQRDIRTLTYLGYLGINSPRYKILAQRLSENDSILMFAIKERGNKNLFIKTASEISGDNELISNLPQKDAQMIGFAAATEQAANEKKQKMELLSSVEQEDKCL